VERPFKAAMPAFVPAFFRMQQRRDLSLDRQRAASGRLKIVTAREETKI
jgi:hypothetical protein